MAVKGKGKAKAAEEDRMKAGVRLTGAATQWMDLLQQRFQGQHHATAQSSVIPVKAPVTYLGLRKP